jgi:hypothetical protein
MNVSHRADSVRFEHESRSNSPKTPIFDQDDKISRNTAVLDKESPSVPKLYPSKINAKDNVNRLKVLFPQRNAELVKFNSDGRFAKIYCYDLTSHASLEYFYITFRSHDDSAVENRKEINSDDVNIQASCLIYTLMYSI